MVELRATITGQVQGVRYREFVQNSADTLGLVGCVYNEDDGSVLVVAQGLPETLKEFVEYLHEGSLNCVVAGVAVEWGSVEQKFDEFTIIHR